MKSLMTASVFAAGLAGVAGTTPLFGQDAGTAEAHRAIATEAAGQEHAALLRTVCPPPRPAAAQDAGARGAAGRGGAAAQAGTAQGDTPPPTRQPPARERWHAEPVKVFDNLYFVGQTEYSA